MSPYRLGITRTSNWVGSWTIWKTQASGHVRKVRKRIRATGNKTKQKVGTSFFLSEKKVRILEKQYYCILKLTPTSIQL